MTTPPLELGPGRFRAIQRALCGVSRTLAQQHGQRQFYALAQVRAGASAVAPELQPWIFAVFVTRADFEAWFAMREAPGSYEALRAALSTPARAPRVTEWSPTDDWTPTAEELWGLAQLLGDLTLS